MCSRVSLRNRAYDSTWGSRQIPVAILCTASRVPSHVWDRQCGDNDRHGSWSTLANLARVISLSRNTPTYNRALPNRRVVIVPHRGVHWCWHSVPCPWVSCPNSVRCADSSVDSQTLWPNQNRSHTPRWHPWHADQSKSYAASHRGTQTPDITHGMRYVPPHKVHV